MYEIVRLCITVILLHNLLSFKYYQNESIQILLVLCLRTIILLLITENIILLLLINYCYYSTIAATTKTIIQEPYLNRLRRLDIRKRVSKID